MRLFRPHEPGKAVMDAIDIDRIEHAQACLRRARAKSSEPDVSNHAGELMHHLDMVLRVVTGIRVLSGELDDVQLAVTPPAHLQDGC
jgi:hypothetical protein